MTETTSEREYFQQRAETEIGAAQAATHAAVVRAHYELASHYLDLVHNLEAHTSSDSGPRDRDAPARNLGLHIVPASRHA